MISPKDAIAILILAAGASTRMGKMKQLLPWKGTTLLGNAIQQAENTNAKNIYIVLGANANRIKEALKTNLHILVNSDWKSGLGSSLAYGVRHIQANKEEASGVLVLLADQPLIDTTFINSLIDNFEGDTSIVTTGYKNRVGVPAVFGSAYFSQLAGLHKDFGAKELIQQHKDRYIRIEGGAKTIDIDTLEDYEKLTNN